MENTNSSKLTNKTPEGIEVCIANAQERLDRLNERPDAGTRENPALDALIAEVEGYIRRRKIDGILFDDQPQD